MPDLKNRPRTRQNEPMLKMKELTDATGVPKSTILLYAGQGLLPKPVKTSPNMAYYDPVCIDRIAFIKQVQSVHRLPLAAIKGLIREMDKGENVDLMLELQTKVFGSGKKRLGRKAYCRATGLTGDELDLLCRLNLIIPLEDGRFNSQDKDMGVALKKAISLGVSPQDLSFYPETAKNLVEKELRLREKHTRDLDFEANAALTLELTRTARSIRAYVIDRIMQKKLMAYKGLKK